MAEIATHHVERPHWTLRPWFFFSWFLVLGMFWFGSLFSWAVASDAGSAVELAWWVWAAYPLSLPVSVFLTAIAMGKQRLAPYVVALALPVIGVLVISLGVQATI